MAGRATPATTLLRGKRVPHTVHSYHHDPRSASYGMAAARALDVPPERVFKTLLAEVDGALTVGIVPVTRQLDLKALALAVGGKRTTMAAAATAERATGYVLGGISPLGQRKRLPVVLDGSAAGFDTLFCSAGRRGLEIELAPSDLIALTSARVAAIGC